MQCTKTIYPHSKYNYVTCTNSVERFSDTPTNLIVPPTDIKEMQTIVKPVSAVTAELQGVKEMQMSSMQPIVKPVSVVSVVTAELQGVIANSIKEMQNPTVADCDICDKTSLYYTIGVLVILLIILIGYTIYQSGKNSN